MTPAIRGDTTRSPSSLRVLPPEGAGSLLVPVAAPAPQRPDMVGGEAGMGKSVLADRLVRQARTSGVRVARGACSAAGVTPLWPWQRALTEIAPRLRWHGDGGASPPSPVGT